MINGLDPYRCLEFALENVGVLISDVYVHGEKGVKRYKKPGDCPACFRLVDLVGIEPMTSSMPWRRSPS